MTKHSDIGASSASRWMNCPGSVRQNKPFAKTSNVFADEGTAAHHFAEMALRSGRDGDAFIGKSHDVNGVTYECDEDMAAHIQVYLDTVRGLGGKKYVEQHVDLSNLADGMFGTLDCCVIAGDTLHVLDFKYGKGVAVEVENNSQLRFYAYGAWKGLAASAKIKTIVVWVVQPRAIHRDGPVRSVTYPAFDVIEFAEDLRDAAARTRDPNAPLKAGSWCQWCPSAGVCVELRESAAERAGAIFTPTETLVPNDPSDLTPADVARYLNGADMIEAWIDAIRAHALRMAEGGEHLPGWKLVPRRAIRKWKDEASARDWLKTLLDKDQLYKEPAIESPAQIEKLLPKEIRPELAEYAHAVSSGVTLAKEGDARPAQSALTADKVFSKQEN